jgi:hypothetical protein
MLMGTESAVNKGKSLHVYRNNKNHIFENLDGKHSHCFLIHLNKKEKNRKKINLKRFFYKKELKIKN